LSREAADLKLSPHGTRHSAITAFLDASGGDVRSAQSLSRHKDPRTLMIYDDNRQGLQGKASQALGDLLDLSESEC
jgi:integrase/recombinase XerC